MVFSSQRFFQKTSEWIRFFLPNSTMNEFVRSFLEEFEDTKKFFRNQLTFKLYAKLSCSSEVTRVYLLNILKSLTLAFCHSKFRCKNTIFFAVVIQFSLRLEACQLALPWHVNIWQFQKNVACFFFVFNPPSQRSVSSRNQFFVLYLEWRNGIISFWSKGTI